MKNLIILAVFLVAIGGLIFWLWSDKNTEPSVTSIESLDPTQTASDRARPQDLDPALSEVELSVGDEGLVLDRLYGKQLDLLITRNEVKDVAVLDGILTFSELEEGNWNFKAINLEQYIEAYLK